MSVYAEPKMTDANVKVILCEYSSKKSCDQ